MLDNSCKIKVFITKKVYKTHVTTFKHKSCDKGSKAYYFNTIISRVTCHISTN